MTQTNAHHNFEEHTENPATKVVSMGKDRIMPEGFFFGKNGLNYLDPHNDNASPVWICSRLEVTASTRDIHNRNWGRVLEFEDMEGHHKRWTMPMEMLAGRGEILHSTLLNMGLNLSTSTKAKNLLAQFIQACTGQTIAVCVDRIGWFDECYVLPDRTLGDTKGKQILLQTEHPDSLGFSQGGTLTQWRDHVASYAVGNSRLAFAISASLTAPLISLLGIEGGGFHFRGESSQGKTIALYAAGSVWGDHARKKMWRATTNGLEQTAFVHNDSLLMLDEMGEMNPREIGNAVYMLANGQAKQRMTEAQPKQWRLLFLSTGEIDLKTAMLQAGAITKAGQEVRLIDVEAVTGKHGVFDVLIDGFHCSKDQAEQLQTNTAQYYGTAGIAFLEKFIANRTEAMAFIDQTRKSFIEEQEPTGATGQIKRVLNRFSVVAAGGELASHFGLTGWKEGEATQAAIECFKSWLANMDSLTQPQEHQQAIERIRLFIEQHGESRFNDLDKSSTESQPVRDRVGYKKLEEGGTVYYFTPAAFRNEVCSGLNWKTVATALKVAGHLKHQPDRLTNNTPPLEDGKRVSSYAVKSSILGGE
ncbi:MAG: DUF927 domain-containing protein [Hydrogenovibrio sp.]|uniref:DUF927 domain-containing protein n=1 Tax=Hydrogenovibrio sp. TaxID=2065821 RepID=UPI0028701838|nr:DUF927 domain-containing protein [Hydrogenovibrio sp.]MDR9499734.1 DUF927 domain-containing protein [Hydrogenovibrio sp.]